MRIKTKSLNLLVRGGCWVAIIMFLAAHISPIFTAVAENVQPMPTITPTPVQPQPISFPDYFRLNVTSIAALLASIGGIFAFAMKIFKPIRRWIVSWIRRSLNIEDSNKLNEDRISALESKIIAEAEDRKKDFAAMKGQNDTIEGSLACLLASTNEINRKLNMSEESNRSLVRDAITKTFYKFNKRQAIPIHEKENMGKLFDVYKMYGGNSYVCSLMEIANEWEVLSGEDAPSCRIKQQ